MDQDESFLNPDIFNVHDITEIEGKKLRTSLEASLVHISQNFIISLLIDFRFP